MGTFKKGILGGFSGKVGNVIGSSWKGISYMRSIPQKVNNPQTPKQEAHRKKFKLILDYLKPLSSILELGFQDYTQRQTGLNAALSHNIKNAISGTSPNWQINKHELLIARGTLTPIERIHFQRLGQLIIINWINNTGAGNASANDKAIAIMYNTTRKEIKAITTSAMIMIFLRLYLSTTLPINGPSKAVGSSPQRLAIESMAADLVSAVRYQITANCTVELLIKDSAWPVQRVKN